MRSGNFNFFSRYIPLNIICNYTRLANFSRVDSSFKIFSLPDNANARLALVKSDHHFLPWILRLLRWHKLAVNPYRVSSRRFLRLLIWWKLVFNPKRVSSWRFVGLYLNLFFVVKYLFLKFYLIRSLLRNTHWYKWEWVLWWDVFRESVWWGVSWNYSTRIISESINRWLE